MGHIYHCIIASVFAIIVGFFLRHIGPVIPSSAILGVHVSESTSSYTFTICVVSFAALA
jgi:hypothetical protein